MLDNARTFVEKEKAMAAGTRRTLAQLLAAMSVASCSTLVLAPFAANQVRWEVGLSGVFMTIILAVAAVIVRRG